MHTSPLAHPAGYLYAASYVDNNNLTLESAMAISKFLPKLTELYISRNPIGMEGCLAILINLSHLKKLHICKIAPIEDDCQSNCLLMYTLARELPALIELRSGFLGCSPRLWITSKAFIRRYFKLLPEGDG